MFGKIVIIGSLLLTVCVAELPVNAPYAPSGWRPQGEAFTLPSTYLAPLLQPENGVVLGVTKERVVYAGQVTESNAAQVAVGNNYLPPGEPSTVDAFRGQGLPSRFRAPFKAFRPAQLNTREFFPKQQQIQFRGVPPFSARFRNQQFNKQVLSPSPQYEAPIVPPSTSYGVPDLQPATQYGAPDAPNGDEQNDDLKDGSIVAGEYFILTPEKTLQKVSYKTFQTDEDAAHNGFTAQLKYTPVEKVEGPLYKYNADGQLVKISKK